MSRLNDKKDIWVVSPIKENDGEIRIQGYTRLRKMRVACTPANGYIDYKTYGSKVNRMYKFNSNKPIDVEADGGDGIYFEKPTPDKEDGLYKKPTLISQPLTHFGKQWYFTAEKQVY